MRAVSYYRVSTSEQGRSGLGLEAQKAAVEDYLLRNGVILVAEFTEVESGARNDRPQLQAALKRATLSGATLVIAKLDRLSRNAAFLLTLRDAGTDIVAVDMPNANSVTVGIMAVIAEEERRLISERTKAAMKAAKASAWPSCQRDRAGRLAIMSSKAQRMRFSSISRVTSLSGQRM